MAAAQAGADQLAIGTELEQLQAAPAFFWHQLLARVHAVFAGRLTYALYHPWQRDAAAQAEPADPEEQAAAYNAALSEALVDRAITGIFFWAWSVPLFEPNWKPAAKVLYQWYTSPQA